ncbi:amidohydrolase [Microbacterium sp. JB110]|uniref:amidohydrolase n=1 Tax=Microbacterium sp. JB110 TaxID=2024477 RepID=UPI00097EA2CA|nr:amidohydrolase [Microbacterium sp. JB110]RCS60062.1 amidohydrolase [Microbacterium sp. JB110]SJM45242.1 Catalyzes the cleavage of p-aminobenzoyl-glutamate to p-aminobenzoate and glutamate, subunit A [Frigoribacterium sp. JB110]
METEDDLAGVKARAAERLAVERDALVALSHRIHADPELSWQEHRAAAAVADALRGAGFDTQAGAYGVDTAVEAVRGDGDMTVVICAEYDALPGVGHACGHNVIATIGIGAAIALADVAHDAGLRVKLLGTPAEEHGGGKVSLLAAGAFEDATCSLMVHGGTGDDAKAATVAFAAVERFEVEFTGRAAHAAAAPEKAINAGAAATLALTAIGLLRQQLPGGTSVNAFVSDGGEATNIIAERAVVQAEVRAHDLDTWRDLKRRILACLEGAAIAMGCHWEHRRTEHPYAPLVQHPELSAFWDANLVGLGRAPVSSVGEARGSTDMGNVSQVLPALHPMISFLGETAVPHHPDFAAAAASPAADDAIIDGATALAWTVIDAALSPEVREDLLARQSARPAGATRETMQN